jgi:hypothetical protein
MMNMQHSLPLARSYLSFDPTPVTQRLFETPAPQIPPGPATLATHSEVLIPQSKRQLPREVHQSTEFSLVLSMRESGEIIPTSIMTAEGHSKIQAESIGQLNAGVSKIRNRL